MHPKKGSPFKKFSQIIRRRASFKGGIEQIQPNMISGWVFCNGQKLDFVELVYGNNLIAKARIDTYRNDIARSYDFHGCSGFSIPIPEEIPILSKNMSPKIMVYNEKRNIKFEIKLLNLPQKTTSIIKKLLNSKFKGFTGKFNGIDKLGNVNVDLKVPGHINNLDIWMHSNKIKPKKITSEDSKVDNSSNELKIFNFKMKIKNIPLINEDQMIWFCYDQEGIFIIPKDLSKFPEPIHQSINLNITSKKYLEKNSKSKNDLNILKEEDFADNLDHIPPELRGDFMMVDNCKILLDTIESKLEQIEKNRKRIFFKKYFKKFKNNILK